MTLFDHNANVNKRIAMEYRESNLLDLIEALVVEFDNIEDVVTGMLSAVDIDIARGETLDLVGRIVGQKRELQNVDSFTFFGFSGHPQAETFSDLNNPGLGARLITVGEETTGIVSLSDVDYRLFIKARITRNHIKGNANDVAAAIAFIINVEAVHIVDQGGASALVLLNRILTNNEKLILQNTNIIPKPAGVSFTLSEYEQNSAFGFNGYPGALGFSDLNNPTLGGRFSSIFGSV